MPTPVLQQPTSEPVSLDDVKARLRLTSTDDDALITAYISAAREHAERVSRRSLAAKQYSQIFDRFPFANEPIRLTNPPVVSVDAIRYLDYTLTSQTWEPSAYFVAANQSPALVIPAPGNCYPPTAFVPGAVEVDFTTGPSVDGLPVSWKQNIIEIAVFIYDHPGEIVPASLVTIPKIFVC